MLFPENVVKVYKKTACNLKGSAKRIFMAEVVKAYGLGAQREAEARLKWCRNTIKKGSHEMKSGIICIDNFQGRGRKKAEEKNIDMDDPKYQVLIQETIRELLPLYGNSGASNSTTVNGKPFSRV